jgi:DNA-binding CsgD family transcriptional regulator
VAGEHAPLFSRYVTDFLEDDLPHNPAAFRHQPIRAPMQSEVYRRSRVYRDFYRANGITDKLHMLVAGNGSFEPGAVAVSLTRMGRQSDFTSGDVDLARLVYPAFEASARRAIRWGILRRRFGLTRAEADVLALLAVGLSNIELARRLHVSLDTIKRHLYHVFRKLNVSSRVQAALRARNLL